MRDERRGLDHPSRALIADICSEHKTVLECGCATAIDYPLHIERGTKYTGIDITPKLIELAKELNPGIDAREASILELPFEFESFDTVYERAVFEHMHYLEWPLALQEMWRVASSQVIIACFGWSKKRYHKKSILERMKTEEVKNGPTGPFTNAICHPDMVEVLDELIKPTSWEIIEIGGKHSPKSPNGRKYPLYRIYIIKK
ncbi:MAG: class I SAM-dependent methyltransferase [Candidatus Helarchaeota archaeon]